MNYYEQMNRERDACVKTKKRVAAYCRVSTDKRDQANSFESQQRYFKEYIEKEPDWELVEIFADRGISGTSTKKRLEFLRMISVAKQGDIDLIVTKEVARFARNLLDSIKFTRELKKIGVHVLFMQDNINTADPDSELRLSIMATLAQDESRRISERVKWGQTRRMEQGVVFGKNMLGYDIKNGKLHINESGAKIVRLIFSKYVNEGKGTSTIAHELMEDGFETIFGNSQWSRAAICKIIRNEKYCGDLVQKKTFTPDYLTHEKKRNRGEEKFIIIKDHHAPIISRELFSEANKILEERAENWRKKSRHSKRHVLSGKIICGNCGNKFAARFQKRGMKTYEYWRCLGKIQNVKPDCFSKALRNQDILKIIHSVLNELKIDKKNISAEIIKTIQSVISASAEDAKKFEKIKSVEEKKERLLELYLSNEISRKEFIKKRKSLESFLLLSANIPKPKVQENRLSEIFNYINEIIQTHRDEIFIRNIIKRVIVQNNGNIQVDLF